MKTIDWDKYNEPPYLPQWLCEGETLELAKFDDKLRIEVEKQLRLMAEQYDLDNLNGEMLDRIGKLLSEPRLGNNDDIYRIYLKLRILLNTTNGTVNDIIKVVKFFFSSEAVHIIPNYPAGLSILRDGEGPPINFNKILAAIIPAGVAYDTKELFNFFENVLMLLTVKITIRRNTQDLYPAGLRYNGRFLCDQGKMIHCDGSWICDGSINCAGVISVIGTVFDFYLQGLFCDGSWICNGDHNCTGWEKVFDDEIIQLPILPRQYMRDELKMTVRTQAMQDAAVFFDDPMQIRIIHPLIADGNKRPECSVCDGTWLCDGTFDGFDGRYYRFEIHEEAL